MREETGVTGHPPPNPHRACNYGLVDVCQLQLHSLRVECKVSLEHTCMNGRVSCSGCTSSTHGTTRTRPSYRLIPRYFAPDNTYAHITLKYSDS